MLEIKKISKKFEKNLDKKIIFDDFSLTINKGEFVILLGANGAGKSTLLNLISGSIFPDSGSILLNNEDITFLPEHKRAKFIGRVFQDPLKGTAPNLTLEENLVLAYLKNSKRGLAFGVNSKIRNFFKEEIVKLNLGLENRMNAKIGLLSGGQRQAITLLMATFIKPKILLLDEHTAALDPKSRDNILKLTKQISECRDMITIMITHNHEFIELGSKIVNL